MRIKPITKRGEKWPSGAQITLAEADIATLAEIVSYARQLSDGKAGRMVQELAAIVDAISPDEHGVEPGKYYDKVRKLFDPEYGGTSS